MSIGADLESLAKKSVGDFHVSDLAGIIRSLASDVHRQKIDRAVQDTRKAVDDVFSKRGGNADSAAEVMKQGVADFYQELHKQLAEKVGQEFMNYMRDWSSANSKKIFESAMRSGSSSMTKEELSAAVKGLQEAQMRLGAERVRSILVQDAHRHIDSAIGEFSDAMLKKAGIK